MRVSWARLIELLAYDPLTGLFTRIAEPAGRLKVGDIAGTVSRKGYIHIQVDGKLYYGHRLAWLYMTGEWPEGVVDHRDGNRARNVWRNLRDVPQKVNLQNKVGPSRRNKSGLAGVSQNSSATTFYARIGIEGGSRFLGSFPTGELAHAAYLAAKRVDHVGYIERTAP